MSVDIKEFFLAMALLVVTLLLLASCSRRGCFPTTTGKHTFIPNQKKHHGFQ